MKERSSLTKISSIESNTKYLKDQGNIKPLQLYELIKFPSGKADHLAIDLYSDFRSWYRPKKYTESNGNVIYISKLKTGLYKTSYCYLAKKYRVSKETIRAKLVKLEELGLLSRAFTIEKRFYNREENNVLNILVWKDTPHFVSNVGLVKTEELLGLCYRKIILKDLVPSPDVSGDIYSKTNNLTSLERYKSRSSESNFVKSNLEEEILEVTSQSYLQNSSGIPELLPEQEIQNQASVENTCLPDSEPETSPKPESLVDRIKSKVLGNKKKPILEFYPVSEEEARNLSISSAREFNLNYINKLVERLGGKYPEHGFYTRKLFMRYLSLVLANELREENIVNNETFRFRADIETDRREKYLSCVEDSISNDTISQLRRKIVAAFNQSTAYMLLTTCTFKGMTEDQTFEISVTRNLELSEHYDRLLLDQIKSVYGNHTQGIEFTVNPRYDHTKQVKPQLPLNLGEEGSLWNRVSTKLLNYYGEGLHRSWFSRLEAVEDKGSTDNASNDTKKNPNELVLKAPTTFFRDYIISNYRSMIERFCKEEGLSYGEIYC